MRLSVSGVSLIQSIGSGVEAVEAASASQRSSPKLEHGDRDARGDLGVAL